MNMNTRVRIAVASAVPCALTLPIFCLLAAIGMVPWDVLPALLVALAVLTAISLVRLRGFRPDAASPDKP